MENILKKRVIIRSGTLKMGGLERVLIEFLQSIEKDKYDLYLFIENNAGKENVFFEDVPKWIKVYFLKPESIMRKAEFYRANKKGLYCKLMYNIVMNFEKYLVKKNTKEYIKSIGKPDVFIDFDAGATKYIETLNIGKSFVWLHSSVKKVITKEKKLKKYGYRLDKYSNIVAICDEMKEELKELYPYLKDKLLRVYNPFNFQRILNSSEDESSISQQEKQLMNNRYILAVARLDDVQKDFPTLIKAFKILKEKGKKEKLYIIGEGPARGELETLIKEYALEEMVYLLGAKKNPYVWMKNADFFVHSSKYEGLPTVLIEAMICDKVVVSSNCPTGPSEILKNGEFGILFNVGDYKTLAKQIEEFIDNQELRKCYENKIKERAKEFENKKIIEEFYKIIG